MSCAHVVAESGITNPSFLGSVLVGISCVAIECTCATIHRK